MRIATDDHAVKEAEKEIDAAFEASPLLSLDFNQAAWTVLAVNEDIFHRRHYGHPSEEMHALVDSQLNALTHPLRACLKHCKRSKRRLQRAYIPDDYGHAARWLSDAYDYDQFCTIFPLWYRKQIKLSVEGKRIVVESAHDDDKTYEAYNRLVRKESRADPALDKIPDSLLALLRGQTKSKDTWFRLDYDRDVVSQLVELHRSYVERRFTLPADWKFAGFSLKEYREVILTLQSMMHGWYLVRCMVANGGMPGMGYRSAVWVVKPQDLLDQLVDYTSVRRKSIEAILSLLTFGSNGIRYPDIATQPLVDLGNEQLALSPFVFLNSSIERNLCTLLNQIPNERDRYSTLVDEKETSLVGEIRVSLAAQALEITSGKLKTANLDVAIIDRENKVCLCLELKWFIEPAEIRELGDRTKDLKKGVDQAKWLAGLFAANDKQLVKDVLKIDHTYDFFSAVGSVNWIGMTDVQDPAVPIVKVWHLVRRLKREGLLQAISWLRGRRYLPRAGVDFTVVPVPIETGKWKAEWYGLKGSPQAGDWMLEEDPP